MEPVFGAGVFLNGKRMLGMNPDSLVFRFPNADEVLFGGERICELERDLEPERHHFRKLHDLLHIVHRSLPLGFLVEPEHLERQTAALLRYHQRHTKQNGTVFAAGHTDDHIIVIIVDKADSLQRFLKHIVFQINHAVTPRCGVSAPRE